MSQKKNTKQKSQPIEQIQQAYGFSKEDSEALLVHAAEVQTTDPIPIDQIAYNANVDSTPTTLNNLQENNPSSMLDRNAPKDSYE